MTPCFDNKVKLLTVDATLVVDVPNFDCIVVIVSKSMKSGRLSKPCEIS